MAYNQLATNDLENLMGTRFVDFPFAHAVLTTELEIGAHNRLIGIAAGDCSFRGSSEKKIPPINLPFYLCFALGWVLLLAIVSCGLFYLSSPIDEHPFVQHFEDSHSISVTAKWI